MTKRLRTATPRKKVQVESLPQEIWFLIGECIEWFEVGTLINFLSVSRMAVRFIQPTLRILVNNFLEVEGKKNYEAVRYCKEKHGEKGNVIMSVSRYFGHTSNEFNRFYKCLNRFYSNDAGTLVQWREWSGTILSMINLCRIYERYNNSESLCKDSKTETQWFSRVTPISSAQACTPLAKIYYFPRSTKGEKSGPRPLHMMRFAHVVEGMPKDERALIAAATEEIDHSLKGSKRELYTSALRNNKSRITTCHRRALCYHVLSKKLNVREARATDSLRDVVVANPSLEDDYLHIFSEYSKFIDRIYTNCCVYKGKAKEAPIALHLHEQKHAHTLKCIKDCISLSDNIKNS